MNHASGDPYLDPETGILRNRLGAVDLPTLEKREADYVFLRTVELRQDPEPGRYDLEHFKAIHRRLFADIYDWAGEVRSVEISKGDSLFASVGRIAGYAEQITKELRGDGYLRERDAEQFSARAAYYLSEWNALHPFREGNGRTTRQFFRQLAQDAGYNIRWQDMSRDAYLSASIASFQGDLEPLTVLVRENLHPHTRSQERGSADRERELRVKAAKERIMAQLAERERDGRDTGRSR